MVKAQTNPWYTRSIDSGKPVKCESMKNVPFSV